MINHELNESEKGYFAGLFDGEGCVSINKSKHISGKKTSFYYKLNVTFGITYKKVLTEMKCLFGGSLSLQDMVKQKEYKSIKNRCLNPENWKQLYIYNISGWDARCFLKIIEPYCKEKKEQACVAIEFIEGKKPRCTSEYETERGEFYYLKLQRLKKMIVNEDEEYIKDIDFKSDQMDLVSFKS